MDHFVALTAFVEATQESHFPRATAQLGIKPSIASRYIKDIEQRLGIALFNRSTRTRRTCRMDSISPHDQQLAGLSSNVRINDLEAQLKRISNARKKHRSHKRLCAKGHDGKHADTAQLSAGKTTQGPKTGLE